LVVVPSSWLSQQLFGLDIFDHLLVEPERWSSLRFDFNLDCIRAISLAPPGCVQPALALPTYAPALLRGFPNPCRACSHISLAPHPPVRFRASVHQSRTLSVRRRRAQISGPDALYLPSPAPPTNLALNCRPLFRANSSVNVRKHNRSRSCRRTSQLPKH
jgi:hypothetical protein